MKTQPYLEHTGKVVEAGSRFSHVMAIALDPTQNHLRGVIRCIMSREGDVAVKGFIDRSELHLVRGDSLERFEIGERLTIKNEEEIVRSLSDEGLDYLGLEDPDLFLDESTGLMHLYCTMPFISRDEARLFSRIHLGHAQGKNLESLEMTMPVLLASSERFQDAGAKEVSIAPVNTRGVRLNLFEGHDKPSPESDTYSTIRAATARNMGAGWEFGPTVFHPAGAGIPWIGGHASPGPLLPRSFIDVGEGKLVGIANGREANKHEGDKTVYGTFSVGICICDYENGRIEWMSPEPLIQDSDARTITFASQFVETSPGEGVLYAHVDDSFVRAYTLYADEIRSFLP